MGFLTARVDERRWCRRLHVIVQLKELMTRAVEVGRYVTVLGHFLQAMVVTVLPWKMSSSFPLACRNVRPSIDRQH
jgi:hypothetical protein